ncbi:MAG: YceI family protein [Sporocytophaga sp.]|uniref:YceI family protein n=1 Tax=Sporocytophaga sp. TaxID=2231183 RepID=UPI001B2E5125|nr:YceI family protein [Sporocytophaga sp.]MBO9703798.1 YceI family protein [Sporocytophaga sp.]
MIPERITLFLKLFLSCLFLNNVYAQTYTTEKGHAEFKAKASLNSYTGTSNQLRGSINLNEKTVYFSIPFESIDTGIEKRNKHMKELIETDKYPNAEFEGKIISNFDTEKEGSQKVTVKGHFKMHGVSKEITVEGTLTRKGSNLIADADWKVLITDYKITPPKMLGNKVQDEHTIVIKAEMEKRD